jgi:altronate dehydratase small subunit
MKGRTIDDAAIVLADSDTVATALEDLSAGRTFAIGGRTVELTENIEFGHKFALQPIDPGERVYKYGEVIGKATEPIAPGDWVHTHNIESTRARPNQEANA